MYLIALGLSTIASAMDQNNPGSSPIPPAEVAVIHRDRCHPLQGRCRVLDTTFLEMAHGNADLEKDLEEYYCASSHWPKLFDQLCKKWHLDTSHIETAKERKHLWMHSPWKLVADIKGDINAIYSRQLGVLHDWIELGQGNEVLAQDLEQLYDVLLSGSHFQAEKKLSEFCTHWGLEQIKISQKSSILRNN